jgi:allantoinase
MTVTVDEHTRVFTGSNVLLPGSQVPQPATVLVSAKTGKIIEVHAERLARTDCPEITDDNWLEVDDDKYLLPGLVEYVQFSTHRYSRVQSRSW